MPKKLLLKVLTDHWRIREHPSLRFLGTRLRDPNLFHITERSLSGGFAVGLFVAWVPLPFQMILAALAAIFVRVNLPVSVILVWITNPITMPAMLYLAYRIGLLLTGEPEGQFSFELSIDWFRFQLVHVWEPLLLGCTILGILSSVAGYITVRLAWESRFVRLIVLKSQRKLRDRKHHTPPE